MDKIRSLRKKHFTVCNLFLPCLLMLLLTGCSGQLSGDSGSIASSGVVSGEDIRPSSVVSEDIRSSAAGTSDDIRSAGGYEFCLPKDFESRDAEGFICFYEAEDGSSVSMNVQELSSADSTEISSLTQSDLHQALEETYTASFHTQVKITDTLFEITEISGYPAYRYSFSADLGNNEIRQLIVGIRADHLYTFTYTDMTGDWMEDFSKSAESINIVQ